MSISENGKVKSTYDYHVDGQVARRVGSDGNGQSFFWDGLALIKRGNMSLTNEPYVTGGNPVIAGDKTLFNDILGTTQGSTDGEKFASIERDAFGQVLDKDTDTDYDYFTGKPKVEGLGYAFLFRNYNAGLGKWTTSDPLGYPDGWNNFAYCNNRTTDCFDRLGGEVISDTYLPSVPANSYGVVLASGERDAGNTDENDMGTGFWRIIGDIIYNISELARSSSTTSGITTTTVQYLITYTYSGRQKYISGATSGTWGLCRCVA